MKVCPADWIESIAMVASGGIYCQYKQAEYIMDGLKAEVQRIRAEGEAERDALTTAYAQASAAQRADYDEKVANLQRNLQAVLDKAKQLLQQSGKEPESPERVIPARLRRWYITSLDFRWPYPTYTGE